MGTARFQLSSVKPSTLWFPVEAPVGSYEPVSLLVLRSICDYFFAPPLPPFGSFFFFCSGFSVAKWMYQMKTPSRMRIRSTTTRMVNRYGWSLRAATAWGVAPILLNQSNWAMAGRWLLNYGVGCDRNDCVCFACSARRRLVVGLEEELKMNINNWTSR